MQGKGIAVYETIARRRENLYNIEKREPRGNWEKESAGRFVSGTAYFRKRRETEIGSVRNAPYCLPEIRQKNRPSVFHGRLAGGAGGDSSYGQPSVRHRNRPPAPPARPAPQEPSPGSPRRRLPGYRFGNLCREMLCSFPQDIQVFLIDENAVSCAAGCFLKDPQTDQPEDS